MTNLVRTIKWVFIIIYLIPASVLGTILLYNTLTFYPPLNKEEKKDITERIPNGFVYTYAEKKYGGYIKDAQGNTVIYPSVDKVKWAGKTIYGKRRGLSEFEEYYFVCDYGDDCLKNQNYTYTDFFKILQKRNLPGFEGITKPD